MVQMLLDSGAGSKINQRDSTGDTPIMYAAYGTGKGKSRALPSYLEFLNLTFHIFIRSWTGFSDLDRE